MSRIGLIPAPSAAAAPLDDDLTAIAALAKSDDDFMQAKGGAWTNRTIDQVKADLGISAAAGVSFASTYKFGVDF